jgi:TM2 domain-containing membrane protein YozV
MAVPYVDPSVPPGHHRLIPAVAAALGLLFPGAGHIYCGRKRTGAIILTVSILTLFLCGFWNLYGAWAGWRLAKQLRYAPLSRRRADGGEHLADGVQAAAEIFDAFD